MECQVPIKEKVVPTDHLGRTPEEQREAVLARLREGNIKVLNALGAVYSPLYEIADNLLSGEVRAYGDPVRAIESVLNPDSGPTAAVLPLQNPNGKMVTHEVAGEELRIIDLIRRYELQPMRLDVPSEEGVSTVAVVMAR